MRIRFLIFKFLIFITCPTLYSQQQATIQWPSLANSPWPILRGDMQGTGRSEFVGPTTNNIIWRKDMPLGVIYGPVIGYNDNLYMGTRSINNDSANFFYSINKNGHENWSYITETSFPNNVGPTLAKDSIIYFGSRNSNLYSLNIDGNKMWSIPNLSLGVLNFIISMDKMSNLYLPVVDTLQIIPQSGASVLLIPIKGLCPRGIVFSPSGDTIYFYSGVTQIGYSGALNAADLQGNLFWSFNPGLNNWGIPVIDNLNKVYVFGRDTTLSKNFLYSINSDGTVYWKYEVLGFNQFTGPTIDKNGNIIFHAFIDNNGQQKSAIISLDYFGNENWTTILDFGNDIYDNWINHELVCDANGKIYCGSSNGPYFYCINSNGNIMWTLDLGDLEYDSCPAIGSDGTLYIGAHKSSTFPYHTQNLIAVRDSPTYVQDYNYLTDYILFQNYPNPFNPTTHLEFILPSESDINIAVYNNLGVEVKVLSIGPHSAGKYEVDWDGTNKFDTKVASGVYFITMKANDLNNHHPSFIKTVKSILLR